MNKRIDELLHAAKSVGVTRGDLRTFANDALERVSRNSAKTYCAILRSKLNDLDDVKLPDLSPLSIRGEATISVYLNEQEIREVERLQCSGKDRMYQLYFLISARTGCRVSDVINISAARIQGERLTYVCQKTGTKAELPVYAKLPEWLNELNDLTKVNDFSKRTFNHKIKQMCKAAGLTEQVATYRGGKERITPKWQVCTPHTARRSFATNLYLRGADLYSISKMMGHSSPDMTTRYICCGLRHLPDNVMDFFK